MASNPIKISSKTSILAIFGVLIFVTGGVLVTVVGSTPEESLAPPPIYQPGYFPTPEECFKGIQRAAKKNDLAGIVACFSQEEQVLITRRLLMQVAGMTMAGRQVYRENNISNHATDETSSHGEANEAQTNFKDLICALENHNITAEAIALVFSSTPHEVKNDLNSSPTKGVSQADRIRNALEDMVNRIDNKAQFIADLSEVFDAMPFQEDKNLDLGQIRCFLDMVNCELTNVQINGNEASGFVKSPTEFSSIYFRKIATGWQAQLDPTDLTEL